MASFAWSRANVSLANLQQQQQHQIDLRHINQPDVKSTALSNSSNHIEIGIDLSEYLLNVEWDVMAVPATRRERSYECCVGAFQGELAPSDLTKLAKPTRLEPTNHYAFAQT